MASRYWDFKYHDPISQFVPLPLDFMQAKLKEKQSEYDKTQQFVKSKLDLQGDAIQHYSQYNDKTQQWETKETKDHTELKKLQDLNRQKFDDLNTKMQKANPLDMGAISNDIVNYSKWRNDVTSPTSDYTKWGTNKKAYIDAVEKLEARTDLSQGMKDKQKEMLLTTYGVNQQTNTTNPYNLNLTPLTKYDNRYEFLSKISKDIVTSKIDKGEIYASTDEKGIPIWIETNSGREFRTADMIRKGLESGFKNDNNITQSLQEEARLEGYKKGLWGTKLDEYVQEQLNYVDIAETEEQKNNIKVNKEAGEELRNGVIYEPIYREGSNKPVDHKPKYKDTIIGNLYKQATDDFAKYDMKDDVDWKKSNAGEIATAAAIKLADAEMVTFYKTQTQGIDATSIDEIRSNLGKSKDVLHNANQNLVTTGEGLSKTIGLTKPTQKDAEDISGLLSKNMGNNGLIDVDKTIDDINAIPINKRTFAQLKLGEYLTANKGNNKLVQTDLGGQLSNYNSTSNSLDNLQATVDNQTANIAKVNDKFNTNLKKEEPDYWTKQFNDNKETFEGLNITSPYILQKVIENSTSNPGYLEKVKDDIYNGSYRQSLSPLKIGKQNSITNLIYDYQRKQKGWLKDNPQDFMSDNIVAGGDGTAIGSLNKQVTNDFKDTYTLGNMNVLGTGKSLNESLEDEWKLTNKDIKMEGDAKVFTQNNIGKSGFTITLVNNNKKDDKGNPLRKYVNVELNDLNRGRVQSAFSKNLTETLNKKNTNTASTTYIDETIGQASQGYALTMFTDGFLNKSRMQRATGTVYGIGGDGSGNSHKYFYTPSSDTQVGGGRSYIVGFVDNNGKEVIVGHAADESQATKVIGSLGISQNPLNADDVKLKTLITNYIQSNTTQ